MTDPYHCETCGKAWVVPSLARSCKHGWTPQPDAGPSMTLGSKA